jgi:hypothetical protein
MKATLLMIAAATLSMAAAAQETATPRIDARQTHQEQRIDQGVASGELTRREAHRLTHQQNTIDRYETRAQADGKVTAKERHRLTHAQNHASRSIYRNKHDRQDRR